MVYEVVTLWEEHIKNIRIQQYFLTPKNQMTKF